MSNRRRFLKAIGLLGVSPLAWDIKVPTPEPKFTEIADITNVSDVVDAPPIVPNGGDIIINWDAGLTTSPTYRVQAAVTELRTERDGVLHHWTTRGWEPVNGE